MSSINSPVLVADCPRFAWFGGTLRIVWQQDGTWLLIDARHGEQCARLLPASWRAPWVMHLRWQLESGGYRRAVIWRWQLSPAQWHLWRQRLTLQAERSAKPVA